MVTKILPAPHPSSAPNWTPAQLPVYLDVVEFRQVVINLMLNAADAMPQGGRLTLRTTRAQELPALENIKGVAPRLPCICLTIQDTGVGIKQRHLASIFDPFFTTKSKGSGLGLYNARIAIEKHQGAISVISKEGAGHQFPIVAAGGRFLRVGPRRRRKPAAPGTTRRSLVAGRAARRSPGQNGRIAPLPQLSRRRGGGRGQSWPTCSNPAITSSPASCLLAEPNDPALNSLPGELRQQNKDLKVRLETGRLQPGRSGRPVAQRR